MHRTKYNRRRAFRQNSRVAHSVTQRNKQEAFSEIILSDGQACFRTGGVSPWNKYKSTRLMDRDLCPLTVLIKMYVNESLYNKKTNEFMSNSNTFKLFVQGSPKLHLVSIPFQHLLGANQEYVLEASLVLLQLEGGK